ncbi:MAG TPA: beta-eliminating lyase-related protein [Trebonia sp.]|nr:beta-eliminating lyase-related protein [Trebonia sp.]
MRLMLWSAPRCRSTAFFRMMAERGDFAVVHEPFSYVLMYGHNEVGGTRVSSESQVVRALLGLSGPVFAKETTGVRYPEVLATPEFLGGWIHTFLIRDPRETIPSYLRLEADARVDSIGFEFLHEIYSAVADHTGRPPAVIDAADLVRAPEATVKAYCATTEIPFIAEALSWAPEHRPEWQPSRRWHEAVATSAGLGAVSSDPVAVPDEVPVPDEVVAPYLRHHLPYYEALHARRLTPVHRGAATTTRKEPSELGVNATCTSVGLTTGAVTFCPFAGASIERSGWPTMATMSSEDLARRIRAAARACTATITWHLHQSPAQVFAELSRACEELGIEEWDVYGEGGALQRLEKELTEAFSVEAAAFFPSGVMAQQVALRIHTDRAATRRVAMPDLSHLLTHEDDGPRVLHGFEVAFLTQGFETPAARHVEALPGKVGAVLVELPLRDAGCLLPTWDDLAGLSEHCRANHIALHFDGARIWESQPWFGHSLAEIAGLADSLYVSFYKGLGGLSGAALLGTADFIKEARLWRRRLGGTLYRTTPPAVSALLALRTRLPVLPDTVTWARAFAAELPGQITVQPRVPHTNQFLAYAAGDADAVNERVLALIGQHDIGMPAWWAAREPGRISTEFTVTAAALGLEPAKAAGLVASALAG